MRTEFSASHRPNSPLPFSAQTCCAWVQYLGPPLGSVAIYSISGLFSSGLILAGVYLVSGIVSEKTSNRIIVVAIFASGLSGFTAENLYGQASYGTVLYASGRCQCSKPSRTVRCNSLSIWASLAFTHADCSSASIFRHV